MKKVLVTGASGFVGSVLCNSLTNSINFDPTLVLRSKKDISSVKSKCINVKNINSKTEWKNLLSDYDVIVHCAARVHVMNDKSLDPLAQFREVNTFGTLNLARSASNQGVQRFVYISSIKVSGEYTNPNTPFVSHVDACPSDPYSVSKYEAEEGLKLIAKETNMEIVIIRPPLVYGPGVKGNFASMLKISSFSLPLPFGAIKNNLRSMVSVSNLADLILTCIDHPKAKNKLFLVSDDEDISTARIFELIRGSLGKRVFMLPVPIFLFRLVGKVLGKSDIVDRLCGNLQVDISETKSVLDWKPIAKLQDEFNKTAKYFLSNS